MIRTPEGEQTWLLFWGLQIGMNEQEIMNCALGKMQDLISCFAISNGSAVEVSKPKPMSYQEFFSLR